MAKTELTKAQYETAVAKILEELGRRRMSRKKLADNAKISISTLEKGLNGTRPLSLSTTVRIEAALGVMLRPEARPDAKSRNDLGGYSRKGSAWLEGDYLTLRPSFEIKGAIYAYRTRIYWDDLEGCLIFQETERQDARFSQKGVVSLPPKSGQIYLQTNEDGQLRLAILNRPLITGEIYGVLTTLAKGKGSGLMPVSAVLALIPWQTAELRKLGRVSKPSPEHGIYFAYLRAILKEKHASLMG